MSIRGVVTGPSSRGTIRETVPLAAVERVAIIDLPPFEAKERTLDEWIATSRATVAYLQSLKPSQFDGSEDRTITWQTRSSTKNMLGTPYLFHHVLPNVFFHVTTAYDILRQAGLEIGKMDYLGRG